MAYKDRNISPVEFLKRLQLEYICAEIRKKIYITDSDVSYWNKVMEGKKIKIIDLSTKNFLPTIFNNDEEKIALYKEVYNQQGLPNFIYKNQSTELTLKPNDIKFYYYPNTSVRVYPKNEPMFLGTIKFTNYEAELLEIHSNSGEVGVYPMSQVSRIL
jgi:hypothetical protein